MKSNYRGQGTLIKVTSLVIGLTVGLVLIAKVQLEMNYDRCIVDKEHMYELQETFQRKGEAKQQLGATSGGIAPVLAREIPEILSATRYTAQFSEEKLTLQDGSRHYFKGGVCRLLFLRHLRHNGAGGRCQADSLHGRTVHD